MPLSEFYRMAKLNLESGQETTAARPADLSFVPDNEFFELVWENGQITMQGQSSRARKNPTSNNAPSQAARLRDRDLGYATASKMGKYGAMDPMLNEISMPVPSVEIGSSQDDDMVPWLNYPIDGTLQQDYCSELLTELSGVTVNEPSDQHSFPIVEKRGSLHQRTRDSLDIPVKNSARSEHGIPSKVSPTRTSQIPCSLQQGQTSVPFLGSGVPGIFSNNTSNMQHAVYGASMQGQASADGVSSMKMQKQDPVLPNRNSNLLNFSHFSRPAAIVRANLQSIDAMVAPGSSGAGGMVNKDKGSMTSDRNPVESTLIDPSTDGQKKIRNHRECIIVPGKVESKPVAMKAMELCPPEQSSAALHANGIKDDKCPNHIIDGSTNKGHGEKAVEPVVASSSVCSGNSVERHDLAHNLKRKCHDTESECRSEDVEEESVSVRKAAPARGVSGSKRSRAAEVHNLSERRRRDRINEKMRALQGLIPNCNKVDKASMLDEAIEYLKTLQLQVQIMSMGASLCLSPMVLPAGMPHIHSAHMPHFSPMGVGMGMGFGYGMGMLDMNGRTTGTSGCPMIPLPPMQGVHFPSLPIAGSTGFQGVAGTNFQVFGAPGNNLPISVPRAPLVPLSGRPPINSSMGFSASRTGFNVEIPNSAPPSNSKDLIQNANSEVICNADAASSMNQTSSKFQGTNEGIHQPALVHDNDQVPDACGSTDVNSSDVKVIASTTV